MSNPRAILKTRKDLDVSNEKRKNELENAECESAGERLR